MRLLVLIATTLVLLGSVSGYEVKTEVKAKPGLGYIAGVVSLGLAGYWIREKGNTLEDITG